MENLAGAPAASPVTVTEVVEVNDPASGAFGGLAFASVVIGIITTVVTLTFVQGSMPEWLKLLAGSTMNVLIFGVILLVLSAILAGFGMVVGKAR